MHTPDDLTQFEAGLAALQIELTADARAKLDAYVGLLKKWQQAINLIGPQTVSTIYTRHILDSIQLRPHLPATGMVLDIGAGAGLPSVVLAITSPCHVTAVERNGKKARFLMTVRRELGLSDQLIVLNEDVSVLADRPDRYDVITARAFAPLEKILTLGLPLLKQGGYFLLPKGTSLNDELTNTRYNTPRAVTTHTSITAPDGKILVLKPDLASTPQ